MNKEVSIQGEAEVNLNITICRGAREGSVQMWLLEALTKGLVQTEQQTAHQQAQSGPHPEIALIYLHWF